MLAVQEASIRSSRRRAAGIRRTRADAVERDSAARLTEQANTMSLFAAARARYRVRRKQFDKRHRNVVGYFANPRRTRCCCWYGRLDSRQRSAVGQEDRSVGAAVLCGVGPKELQVGSHSVPSEWVELSNEALGYWRTASKESAGREQEIEKLRIGLRTGTSGG